MKKHFLLSVFCLFTVLGSFGQSISTDSLRKKAESYMDKSLPKSAADLWRIIMQESKKKSNWPEYLNASLAWAEAQKAYEEDAILLIAAFFEKEVKTLPSPAKEMLYSFLGQLYAEYSEQKRYSFAGNALDTCSLPYLINKIEISYLKSLALQDTFALKILRSSTIQEYSQIINIKKSDTIYRPSLFDFLAFRAINAWEAIANEKPLRIHENILFVFDYLTQIHPSDSIAQGNIKLEKLNYLHNNARLTGKEYEKQLIALMDVYRSYNIAGDIYFQLAQYKLGKADKKNALFYAEESVKKYPISLGAENAKVLIFELKRPTFSLQAQEVGIPLSSIKANLTYKNITNLYIRAYPLSETDIFALKGSLDATAWVENFISDKDVFSIEKQLCSTSSIEEEEIEIDFGSYPEGAYIFAVSYSPDFAREKTQYNFLQMSSLACLFQLDRNEIMKGFVVNRKSGNPLEKVLIEYYSNQYEYSEQLNRFQKEGELLSDKNGCFSLEGAKNPRTYSLILRYKNKMLWLSQNVWLRKAEVNETADLPERNIHWFSDRILYKAGDKIQIKGVLTESFRDSIYSLARISAEVSLFSTQNQCIAKKKIQTNAFGSFYVEFTIPQQERNGQMRLYCEGRSYYFHVEEYKQPSFEIVFENGERGVARNYNGEGLANALYTYRIYQSPFFDFGPSEMVATGNGRCDEKGNFILPPFSDTLSMSPLRFSIEIDVVDLNGEIQRGSYSYYAGKKKLFIEKISDTIWVNLIKTSIPLKGLDVYGKSIPIAGSLKITGENITKEYGFDFKQNPNISIECDNWKQGAYSYELFIFDSLDNHDTVRGNIYFYRTKEKKVFPLDFVFVNVLEQTNAKGDALIFISTPKKNLWVYYEVCDRQNRSRGQWIKLSNEQKMLKIPLWENVDGKQVIRCFWIQDNQMQMYQTVVEKYGTSKDLDIRLLRYRDKMRTDEQEFWSLEIKNQNLFSNKDSFEILVSMYDAALDALYPFQWNFDLSTHVNAVPLWSSFDMNFNFSSRYFSPLAYRYGNPYLNFSQRTYSSLKWPGFSSFSARPMMLTRAKGGDQVAMETGESAIQNEAPHTQVQSIRKPTNETVFFYPFLYSNDSGIVRFEFKSPSQLSRWKFQCFALGKNLENGLFKTEIVTQKELMIFPKLPRFLRMGDSLVIACKIVRTGDLSKSREGKLYFKSNYQNDSLDFLFTENSPVVECSWAVYIPEGSSDFSYQILAQDDFFADGEQGMIPVYERDIRLSNSVNLFVNTTEEKTFDASSLFINKGIYPENDIFTLEFCQSPIWYVLQALPFSMEKESMTDEIARRIYMQKLGAKLLKIRPDIIPVLEKWKIDTSTKALTAAALLPLADPNYMRQQEIYLTNRLLQRQSPEGGFSWMEGGKASRYITQNIIFLDAVGRHIGIVSGNDPLQESISIAFEYWQSLLDSDYKKIIRQDSVGEKKYLNREIAQYLLCAAYLGLDDFLSKNNSAYIFYRKQAEKFSIREDIAEKAILALYWDKCHEKEKALALINSLKEFSLRSKEGGIYYKQGNIETHTLLMFAFEKIGQDSTFSEGLKQWLISQKQTQTWKSEKESGWAIYALFSSSSPDENMSEIQIQFDGIRVKTSPLSAKEQEAGTAYFQKTWNGKNLPSAFSSIKVKKETTKGISYGALYREYSERMEKVRQSKGNFTIRKIYYINKGIEESGREKWIKLNDKDHLHIGDRIRVQLLLESDRDMDYIYINSRWAACFEPFIQNSGYGWENGIPYYRNVKNGRMEYYLEFLKKGRTEFSYEVKVSQKGVYSDGPASAECTQATSFRGNSEGAIFVVR